MFVIIDAESYDYSEVAQYSERSDAQLHLNLLGSDCSYVIVSSPSDVNIDKLRSGYTTFLGELVSTLDGTNFLHIRPVDGFRESYHYSPLSSNMPSERVYFLARSLEESYEIFESERNRMRKDWEVNEIKNGFIVTNRPVLEVGKKAEVDMSISAVWPE